MTAYYLVKVSTSIEGCMAELPSEVDVAVIGAGAAGIAAGRRLAEAKRASFVVIEARERAGGRAWTVAMAAFAADELAALFGEAIRKELRPQASSAWRADPFAAGSYSYALPGHADDRVRLAAPVNDRLFFAGEACSPNFFPTAHGACETGLRAAGAALASLPLSLRPAYALKN
jgi:monoamine oxidase